MREGLEEAGVQVSEDSESMSRRTETAYKAQSPGKSAQHDEAQGSGGRVNAALGVSRWSLTCVEKDHVLIRGDLPDVAVLEDISPGIR